jgi:hypothetical protein
MEIHYLQEEFESSVEYLSEDSYSEVNLEFKEDSMMRYFERSDISLKIQQYIQDVQDELGVERGLALMLLLNNRWDPERIIWDYRNGCIELPQKISSNHCENCPICLSPSTNPVDLECNHIICTECLQIILKQSLTQSTLILEAKCPAPYCESPLDDIIMSKLLSESEFQTYQDLLTNSFISSNKTLKKCKFEDCKFFTNVKDVKGKVFTCGCCREICMDCLGEAHRPLACEQYKFLSQKIENKNIEFTKSCPSCNLPVNLNGDYFKENKYFCHCGYSFCIKCMKYLKQHQEDSCSEIYNEKFKIDFIKGRLQSENELGVRRELVCDLFKIYLNDSRKDKSEIVTWLYKQSEFHLEFGRVVEKFREIVNGIGFLYGCLYYQVFVVPRFNFLIFQIENIQNSFEELKGDYLCLDQMNHDFKSLKEIELKLLKILDYLEKIYVMIEKDQLYEIKDERNLKYN